MMPPFWYFLVHLSVRGSRFSTNMFFLHFGEQNQSTVPSFLTSIVPEPFATGLSQKLHGFTIKLNV
jgi:hypothetical protein